jgi:hypothetical protein
MATIVTPLPKILATIERSIEDDRRNFQRWGAEASALATVGSAPAEDGRASTSGQRLVLRVAIFFWLSIAGLAWLPVMKLLEMGGPKKKAQHG